LHTVARDIETVVRVAEAAMAVVAGKSQAAARMIRVAEAPMARVAKASVARVGAFVQSSPDHH
jgi:hypothetical protein